MGAAQMLEQRDGEVAGAERVLEAVVCGTGEHVVGCAELLERAQPLELARVDERHAHGGQLEMAVHGVVEHFHCGRKG